MCISVSQRIIKNINYFIEKRGIKKTWIADQMDISRQKLNFLLNSDKKNITFDEIYQLSEILGYEIEYFMQEEFIVEPEITLSQRGLPEQILFCGEVERTHQSLTIIGELIDVLNAFKKNNQ